MAIDAMFVTQKMPAPDDSKGMNGPHPHKKRFLARGIKERSPVGNEIMLPAPLFAENGEVN